MISGSNEKELDIANQIADLLLEKEKLQQENKQLKEELEKKNKKYWQQQCAYYSSILYSLEEWLKTVVEYETLHKSGYMTVRGEWGEEVLDKIQELKEKYK